MYFTLRWSILFLFLSIDFIPLIAQFGIYGDNLERVTKYTYNRGFNVLCGSYMQDTTLFWQFTNGSRIGINNPGFREGQFENGGCIFTYS